MKTIGIFYGGRSYEHDISIITAIQAMTYIDSKKYRMIPVYMKDGELLGVKRPKEFKSYLNAGKTIKYRLTDGGIIHGLTYTKLDCALIAAHGGEGENGILQGLLEYYRIPHTGPSAAMSAIGMDKWVSKAVFKILGAETVPGALGDEPDKIESLGYPLIVKPLTLGSSIGIEMAHNGAELIKAVETAKMFDSNVIIEKAISERIELNCAAISCRGKIIISAIEKPVTWKEFLTFNEKYNSTGKIRAEKELPAKIPEELENKVKQTTAMLYAKMRLSGVVRADYLYSLKDEVLYINEINTIPGSFAYYLFSEIGLTFTKLLDVMIGEAIAQGVMKNIEFKTEVLKQYISSGGLPKTAK